MDARSLRFLAIILAVGALAAGCQAQSPGTSSQAAPAANAQADANKATVRHFLESMTQGDTAAVDSMVAENVVDHQGMPGMAPGRVGLTQMITQFHSAFPDWKITVNDMAADGDKVWIYSTMSGTMKGELMGMKPTGKAMNLDGFDLVRFDNGKMVEHWGAQDNMAMMQQLGVTPPMPPGGKPAKKM